MAWLVVTAQLSQQIYDKTEDNTNMEWTSHLGRRKAVVSNRSMGRLGAVDLQYPL